MAGNVLGGSIPQCRHTGIQVAIRWAGMASLVAFLGGYQAVLTSFGLGWWHKLLFIAVWASGFYVAYRCAPAWVSGLGVARVRASIATLGLVAAAVAAAFAAIDVHTLWIVLVPMPVAAGCGFLFYSGALLDGPRWEPVRDTWPVLLIGLTVAAIGLLTLDWVFDDELKGLAAMQGFSALVVVILDRYVTARG